MRKAAIAIGALALAFVAGAKLQSARDELSRQQGAIGAAWDGVDKALERRAALVPDLIQAVAKFAPGEKRLQVDLDDARRSLEGARTPEGRIEANSLVDGSMGRFLVAVETHRVPQSAPEYARLHDELAAAEDRIAVERRKYNEAVQKYNTLIELFPGNLAAAVFGFTRSDAYFKTEPTGRRAPAVKK